LNAKHLVSAVIFTFGCGQAAAQCSADVLNQLRTKYNFSSSSSLSDVTYELTCNKSSNNSSGGIAADILEIATGTATISQQSTAAACARKDRSYFSSNAEQVGLSFISDQAIASCFGGLNFTATQSRDKGLVAVSARFVDASGSGELARVTSLTLTPPGALVCDGADWSGKTIIPGGVAFACERKINTDTVITLNTTKGAKVLQLSRTPKIGSGDLIWSYEVSPANDYLTMCRNQFGNLKGGWVACDADQTCTNPGAIAQKCAERHGRTYVSIDGKVQD
jgi:hypothetical protein